MSSVFFQLWINCKDQIWLPSRCLRVFLFRVEGGCQNQTRPEPKPFPSNYSQYYEFLIHGGFLFVLFSFYFHKTPRCKRENFFFLCARWAIFILITEHHLWVWYSVLIIHKNIIFTPVVWFIWLWGKKKKDTLLHFSSSLVHVQSGF